RGETARIESGPHGFPPSRLGRQNSPDESQGPDEQARTLDVALREAARDGDAVIDRLCFSAMKRKAAVRIGVLTDFGEDAPAELGDFFGRRASIETLVQNVHRVYEMAAARRRRMSNRRGNEPLRKVRRLAKPI